MDSQKILSGIIWIAATILLIVASTHKEPARVTEIGFWDDVNQDWVLYKVNNNVSE